MIIKSSDHRLQYLKYCIEDNKDDDTIFYHLLLLKNVKIEDISYDNLLFWLMIQNAPTQYIEFVLSLQCIDINTIYSNSNENMLFYAAKQNKINYAKQLLKYNIYINQYSHTNDSALLWSIYHRHYDTTMLLIQHGADVYHSYKDGKDAFLWAAFRNTEDIFESLLPYLKNVNKQDNHSKDICNLTQSYIIRSLLWNHIRKNKIYLFYYFKQQKFTCSEFNILNIISKMYS